MKRMTLTAVILAVCTLAMPLAAVSAEHMAVAPAAHETSAKELHSLIQDKGKVLVLDVRSPEEYAKGHVPGAINVPYDSLAQKIREMQISKDTVIVTMCDHGGRSSHAALELRKMGYKTTSFCRIDSWQKDGYRITK
jgi:rhodanese-related sulfurtransferase